MFVGSVPREVVNQLLRVTDIAPGQKVFVCCSGSFRVDLAIKAKQPAAQVFSNDVSLLSCALGGLLTGKPLAFRFVGELTPFEEALAGAGYPARVAGLLVALDALKFNRKSLYGLRHREHFIGECGKLIETARARLEKRFEGLAVDGFDACDFRDHAKRGAEEGALVVAFPPTYKAGYERLYKRLHANVEWQEPAYRLWDPTDIEAWLGELRELRVAHCVFVDHEIEGQTSLARFTKPRARPIHLYGTGKGSSLRTHTLRVQPFRYEAVEPGGLCRDTSIALAPIDSPRFNFLRSRYLAKGIDFADGMYPYAVLLDGKIAGGFCLTRENTGRRDSIYLLSDFSVRRERRLAKLIAMLATSGEALQVAERRLLLRFSTVRTSVFTDKPVSMKYRGIFELEARRDGFLNYVSAARRVPLADIYREWFDRYAADRAQDAPAP